MSRQEDINNNLTCSAVVDLSLPRKEKKEDAENRETKELVKEAGEEEGKTTKLLIGEGSKLSELLGLGKDPSVLESLLPQLDMAAINLLCLARLQVDRSSHFRCILGFWILDVFLDLGFWIEVPILDVFLDFGF